MEKAQVILGKVRDREIYQFFSDITYEMICVMINEARIEAIKECARVATTITVTFGSPHSSEWETRVDTKSILSLIDTIK